MNRRECLKGLGLGAIAAISSCAQAAEKSGENLSFPSPQSKKGLQVQMVDDALALGIKHAALNVNFAQLVLPAASAGCITENFGGTDYYFSPSYAAHLDSQIKPLSASDVVVSLILLFYRSSDEALNRIMLHPRYDSAAPNHLTAFNTSTAEGAGHYAACVEFLAKRYSASSQHGRVWNYIVGNEVNSHWFWSNMGRVTMEEFADDYLRAVRLASESVRRHSRHARIYLSLEHHWNIRYPGGDERQAFAARPFLEYFAKQARQGGDFDWHLAFHPYPENLFECRTWNDKSALPSDDTPRITFKNLEVLTRFMSRPEMHFQGKPRRIILSEQGFHSPETPEGLTLQAAAYCYAWRKIMAQPSIDSFILHRHVDHGQEGGLNLGLWTRNKKAGHPAEPAEKKPIYAVFRQADTPQWEEAFRFALPIIGLTNWAELK